MTRTARTTDTTAAVLGATGPQAPPAADPAEPCDPTEPGDPTELAEPGEPPAPGERQGLTAARVRSSVPVPLRCGGRVHTATLTTFHELVDGREHLAVLLGPSRASVPLVRLHSECLTGDVFASQRCDCGAQLDEALTRIAATGGVLLYLRQEGRGIGLYNKLDAYRLQESGLDTYAANRALGLEEDARDYTVATQMLLALGNREVDLLTNNPDKRRQLESHGIRVRSVVRTGVHVTEHNSAYLRAKATITAHTLSTKGLQT